MDTRLVALALLLAACGGGGPLLIAVPSAVDPRSIFDDTAVRLFEIEVDVDAMNVDLEEQLLLPISERDFAYFEGTLRFEGCHACHRRG